MSTINEGNKMHKMAHDKNERIYVHDKKVH